MQYRSVHNNRTLTYDNTTRAGVQIDGVIEIAAVVELNVISKSKPYAVLDGGPAVHLENQPVTKTPDCYPKHGRNPSDQEKKCLLKHVSNHTRCLAMDIEINLAEKVYHHQTCRFMLARSAIPTLFLASALKKCI
jgi:hypothetical protein